VSARVNELWGGGGCTSHSGPQRRESLRVVGVAMVNPELRVDLSWLVREARYEKINKQYDFLFSRKTVNGSMLTSQW
jgi:hypothetical protein